MIFLKKTFVFLFTLIFASSVFAACSDSDKDKSKNNPADSSSLEIPETEGTTAAEPGTTDVQGTEAAQDLEKIEGTFVYDRSGILSESESDECNKYIGSLYDKYLVNAAVVLTDDLGGMTPDEYAEKSYNDLYGGSGSGFLLLINNDTNKDRIYKTGSCLVSISEKTQADEFYYATNEIIGGKYKDAVMRLMKLIEGCPEHVFGNADVFSGEELEYLENLCGASDKKIAVLAASTVPGQTNEEVARNYYDRHFPDKDGYMIMLNTGTKSLSVVSDANLPAGIDAIIESSDKLASDENYTGAISNLVNAIER